MSLRDRLGRLEGRHGAGDDPVFIYTGVPRDDDDATGPVGALVRGGWLLRAPGEAVEAFAARAVSPKAGGEL